MKTQLRQEVANQRTPSKILVVVANTGMGDAIEALPAFQLIRENWPSVHLAAAYFREKQKAIFERSPHISQIVRLHGNARYACEALKGFPANVKAVRGFDMVLFLYKKDVIAWPLLLAAKFAGAQVLYRHGYRYTDRRRNAYTDFPEHVFFQMVVSQLLLGVPLTRVREPQLPLLAEDTGFAQEFFRRNRLEGKPVVIVNTPLGIEIYPGVVSALVAGGVGVIINGGLERQTRNLRNFLEKVPGNVILLANPSPSELAAVISRSDLYVGNAAGPASVAMAVGTPTVILVGPGEHHYPGQERIGPVWWPRHPKHQVISKLDRCRGNRGEDCNWCRPTTGGHLKQAMKHVGVWKPWKHARKKVMKALRIYRRQNVMTSPAPCLEAITVDEVVDAARRQLNRVKRTVEIES